MAGTYVYRVEPRDVDSTHRIRPFALGDLILQAAGDDADMLGFGIEDLNAGRGQSSGHAGASWVLSRMAIEVSRLPQRHENVAVYTWVSDYGRLMTTRNMVLTAGSEGHSGDSFGGSSEGSFGDSLGVSLGGENGLRGGSGGGFEIGGAVTQWVMIDIATRRPMDLSALSNKGTSLVDREPPIERPNRLTFSDLEGTAERIYEVVYSDIDFNGHVNSMKYVEWMIDSLTTAEIEALQNGFQLEINYLHEALMGERLTIRTRREEPNRRIFEIENSAKTAICRAAISA